MGIKTGLRALTLSAAMVCGVVAEAATYSLRSDFIAQLGTSITDGYDASTYNYVNGGPRFLSDADMTSVLGETRYQTTSFSDSNIVGDVAIGATSAYCAGCNGAFNLYFDQTSFGNSNGVFGVGFDLISIFSEQIDFNVTYANNQLESFSLSESAFFGLTSAIPIYSISFLGRSFKAIDNLTIGSRNSPVPGPVAGAGVPALLVLGTFAWVRRRKIAAAV